jgi:hypothetical protein
MATTNKRLCAGVLTDSSTTLYTAPAGSGDYAILKSLILCNTDTSAAEVTILMNDVAIVSAHIIAAHDTIVIPVIDQILEASDTIKGHASTAAVVTYYLSGKEVT